MVEENKEDMITQANAAADRLKAENDRHEKLIQEMKVVESRRILGGQSNAGATPTPPPVETPQEYAKKVMRGQL